MYIYCTGFQLICLINFSWKNFKCGTCLVFYMKKKMLGGTLPNLYCTVNNTCMTYLMPNVTCRNVTIPSTKKAVDMSWLTARWSSPIHSLPASKSGIPMPDPIKVKKCWRKKTKQTNKTKQAKNKHKNKTKQNKKKKKTRTKEENNWFQLYKFWCHKKFTVAS